MSYSKQMWDTTSYVNPTRMNHIEDGIKDASDSIDSLSANNIPYDSSNTIKQKIDEITNKSYTKVSFTHSSMDSIYKAIFIKSGNLITFNFTVHATASIPAISTLISTEGAIPSDYRPASELWINVGDNIVLVFKTDGSLVTGNISAAISAGYHVFSGAYFNNIIPY